MMNTSAKLTAVSFLAAAALGAAAFMGCSVSSGTDDDLDVTQRDAATTSDSSTTDSGDAGLVCVSKQDKNRGILGDDATQLCAEGQCCDKIQTCFAIAADSDAGLGDCHDYVDCADNCLTTTTDGSQDRTDCFQTCDDTAAPGVKAAYEALVDCIGEKCQ